IISMAEGNRQVDLISRDPDFQEISRKDLPTDIYDPRLRPWYTQSVAEGRTVWTDPYIFFTSQQPGITVASPVQSSDGETLGVVGVDIEFGEISNFLANLEIGQTGRAFIFDSEGAVMAFPGGLQLRESEGKLRFATVEEIGDPEALAALKTLETGEDGFIIGEEPFRRITTDGKTNLTIFTRIAEARWPWLVAVQVPEEDFIGALKDNQRSNIALAVTISGVSALIGLLIARSIIRPINALKAQSDRVAQGAFPAPRPIQTSYAELRGAGAAFARMARWLQQYRETSEAFAAKQIETSADLSRRVSERTQELTDSNTQLAREVEERRIIEKVLSKEVELHRSTSQALRAARDRAHAASRAKSRFLSNVSHEVRTPLNAILGFTALIRHNRNNPDRMEQYAEHITEAGKQLLGIMDQILDLASIEAGRNQFAIQELDAAEIVASASSQIAVLAREAGLIFRDDTDIQPGCHIRADRVRYTQVLMNVASNAIKYNRPGGTIYLRAEVLEGVLRIEIEDTGVGITPEREAEVFEPFNRLGAEATDVEGTGIGLSLSKELVERMKGQIGFTSTLGKGSTFWIDIPMRTPEDLDTHASSSPLVHPVRLLLVEPQLNSVAQLPLPPQKTEMLNVDLARNGTEAISLAARNRYDMIVVDLDLPDSHGEGLLAELRAAGIPADVPAFALTSEAVEVAEGMLRQAGFRACLTKPISLRQLYRLVEQRARLLLQDRPAAE
ncbi:MAG: ATP-binding protein, partial [Pseudomonadota bacterium]